MIEHELLFSYFTISLRFFQRKPQGACARGRPQARGIFLTHGKWGTAAFARGSRPRSGKNRLFFIKVGNMFRFSREKRPRVHDKS